MIKNKLTDETINNTNTVLAICCSEEESQYRLDLINELINIYEHPEDSNKEWKNAIIGAARDKGYGL